MNSKIWGYKRSATPVHRTKTRFYLPPQKKLPLTTLSQTMQEGGTQLGDESLIGWDHNFLLIKWTDSDHCRQRYAKGANKEESVSVFFYMSISVRNAGMINTYPPVFYVCVCEQQDDGCVWRSREQVSYRADAAWSADWERHPGSSEPAGRGKTNCHSLHILLTHKLGLFAV